MRPCQARRMLMVVSGNQADTAANAVEDTLKDFWATRPRRPRKGRKLAGVAAGIGNRYGIDPTVIRVGFVVATFYGGAGILMYLLGWLLLPEQDDEAAPFEAMINRKRSSTSGVFTVVLCLALLPAFWFVFDNQFSGIAGMLIVGGVLFLLHRTRGHLGRPAPAAAPPPTVAQEPPLYQPFSAPVDVPVAEPVPVPTTPPAWDPLGAAPFAWDLPEPTPSAPEPPEPKRRSRAGLLTFGAALIAVAVMAIIGPQVSWMTPPHAIGILLGVIGLGMVGGAFVRGGRGLIGLAVPLSVIGIGLTVISTDGWHGVGDINERPTTLGEVQDVYRRSAGSINLDLTALPDSGKVDTKIKLDVGDAIITVPKTADVDLNCHIDVGDGDCLGYTMDGTGLDHKVRNDFGSDGEGGLQIELDVDAGAGHVEVRRG